MKKNKERQFMKKNKEMKITINELKKIINESDSSSKVHSEGPGPNGEYFIVTNNDKTREPDVSFIVTKSGDVEFKWFSSGRKATADNVKQMIKDLQAALEYTQQRT